MIALILAKCAVKNGKFGEIENVYNDSLIKYCIFIQYFIKLSAIQYPITGKQWLSEKLFILIWIVSMLR